MGTCEAVPVFLNVSLLACCVSRQWLRSKLRALLWLDVSLSFVLDSDAHNKLSMNSNYTIIVVNQLHQLPMVTARREAVGPCGQEPLGAF